METAIAFLGTYEGRTDGISETYIHVRVPDRKDFFEKLRQCNRVD